MGVTCRTVITQGIAALDENTQSDIRKMIEGFEDFTPDNDPPGEHDAGFLYRDVIGEWHTRWTVDSTRPALTALWTFDSSDRAQTRRAAGRDRACRVVKDSGGPGAA